MGSMRPRYARLLCFALALSGCEDFADAPTTTVAIHQPAGAPWPVEVFVDSSFVLTLDLEDASGAAITGLRVTWQSSDSSVLALQPVPPEPTPEGPLVAQRSIRVTAKRRGKAAITAATVQPGLQADSLAQDVRVMERWIAVSAGSEHSCGVTVGHEAYCWGVGSLGQGSVAGSAKPVRVGRDLKLTSITAGNGHSCGILQDSTVQCWGRNASGQLGNGGSTDQVLPVPVSLVSTFATLVAGTDFVCGVSLDQEGFCWGNSTAWQLGDAYFVSDRPIPPFDDCGVGFPSPCSRTPRRIRNGDGASLTLSSIAPGLTHTCATDIEGQVLCWGTGSVELGSPVQVKTDSLSSVSMVKVESPVTFTRISSGDSHTCAIGDIDKLAYCWGFNTFGQLGITQPDSICTRNDEPFSVGCSPTPEEVSGGLQFISLEVGGRTSCGVAVDAAVYCWGSNQSGQLGDPSAAGSCDAGTACRTTPSKIDLQDEPIASVSVGSEHACAVSARGAIYCWGNSKDGRLGNIPTTNHGIVAPVRVDEPD